MRFGETRIHVDPGPGALVRALSHVPPCNPRELDAIVLSHKHLDHSGDVNVLIEAMTAGGFRPRGAVFAPADAFDGEPVVLPYAQRFPERVERLEQSSGPYRIGDVELRTSIAHVHASQTYGLHFAHDGLRVAYLPCGRFFEGLIADYASYRPDVLVINVLRYRDEMSVDHLKWDDARRIVEGVRPQGRGLPALRYEDARSRSEAARARSRRRTRPARNRRLRWTRPRSRHRGRCGCRLRSGAPRRDRSTGSLKATNAKR